MTEISTFKGNWAEFPDEPTFMGRRLLKVERQRFDRACAFAKRSSTAMPYTNDFFIVLRVVFSKCKDITIF